MQSKLKVDAIREVLLKRIQSGSYKKGDLLPTENDLAVEFSASRGTVSKALASLVHMGLLERKPRVGTRVLCTEESSSTGSTELDAYAFIYPGEHHPGIWRIVSAFNEAAQAVGRRTMLISTGSDFEKEADLLRNISELKVKAAAVYPLIIDSEHRHQIESALLQCSCPVVLSENFLPGLNVPAVFADGFDAGYAVTSQLVAQGAKTIGFLGNNALCMTMRDRYMGYRKALKEAGIQENPRYVLQDPEILPDFEHPLEKPVAFARQWMEQAGELPDAVVCSYDYLAQGCLIAAHEAKVSVPEDLRIAMIGGCDRGDTDRKLFTTYDIPFEEIGRETFRRLDLLASGGVIDIADYYLCLQGGVVSCETA